MPSAFVLYDGRPWLRYSWPEGTVKPCLRCWRDAATVLEKDECLPLVSDIPICGYCEAGYRNGPDGAMLPEDYDTKMAFLRNTVVDVRMQQTPADIAAVRKAGGVPNPPGIRAIEDEMFDIGFDAEVIPLVRAMNRLPGIKTEGSCCGHGKRPFHIWFIVTDYNARGLLLLSRLLSHNYYGFYEMFRVYLEHRDIEPQVCWLLEGKKPKQGQQSRLFAMASSLAKAINDHVDKKVEGYNILYDR